MKTLDTPIYKNSIRRIDFIDQLRGFAVLGILIMNIQSFSMPDQAYSNPLVLGLENNSLFNSQGVAYLLSYIFADQKFMAIFSLLFGVSMQLMYESKKGKNGVNYLIRRNLVLLLIGMSHAYLIWHGDILVTYAICAFAVVWLLSLTPKKQFYIGLILFLIPPVLTFVNASLLPYWSANELREIESYWNPTANELAMQVDVFRGGWLQQIPQRITLAVELQSIVFLFETGWRTAGLMLWGAALYKGNILNGCVYPAKILTIAIILFILGFLIQITGIHQNMTYQWETKYSLFFGSLYNYFGSVCLAFAYSGILYWCYYGSKIMQSNIVFKSVGRMALTNYLMQSVVCTIIFYGHGFELFFKLDRVQQLYLLPPIWVLQILFSIYWLNRFRYGPAEWLWRSAVELHWVNIKK